MDPNAVLTQIRNLIKELEYDDDPDHVDMLIERVGALDEWLSKGGYLPLDWTTTPYD